jgi:hypothetical protein
MNPAGGKMHRRQRNQFILFLFLSLFALLSCAPSYFDPIKPPRDPIRFKSLNDLPYRQLWAGIVFNGEKVGFTHLKITSLPDEGLFRLESEAHLRIRFLGLNKGISMKSSDLVRADLSSVSMRHEIVMDDKTLLIEGTVREGVLRTVQKSGGEAKSEETKLVGPLYPAGAINLYPVIRGMAVGLQYQYNVYDPQTQSVTGVSQTVASFERSQKLQLDPAYKIQTSMMGHDVETWINEKGEAIFELGMKGVLITYRESEADARRYLSESSLNKKDLILDFSLVKTEKPLACPRDATLLEVSLTGIAGELPLLQGPGQEAVQNPKDQASIIYRIRRNPGSPAKISGPQNSIDGYRWVLPASQIESDHPEIVGTAREVTKGITDPLAKVRKLTKWVADEVKDEAVDSFSALEVLHTKKGECQAHTMLYTALARALGIPTRMAGGIVYMERVGFLYHAWAESDVGGWISVDPTFDQVGVDATHIKLVEGPGWAAIIPLGRVVGRVKATVIDYQAVCGRP